jgi:hypothetical protein
MKNILNFEQFCKYSITEDVDYYISKNNQETQISKDEFIRIGLEKNFAPKKDNDTGFHIKQDGNKFIAQFTENISTNEMVLIKDKTKIEAFVAKLIDKVKDSDIIKDIKNFVASHDIDPYPYTFKTFIDDLKNHFSDKVDFDIVVESLLTEAMVVTSIDDIPNIYDLVDAGKVTYRGLGMGKKADDFIKLAGEGGTSIKVNGKEYHITRTDFTKLAWDDEKEGWNGKIKFAAPYRKG